MDIVRIRSVSRFIYEENTTSVCPYVEKPWVCSGLYFNSAIYSRIAFICFYFAKFSSILACFGFI